MSTLRQLYDEHAPTLFALALRVTGDRVAAAEVLAEVFDGAGSAETYPSLVRRTRELALTRQSQTGRPAVESIRELPAPRRLVEEAFFGGLRVPELASAYSLPEARVRELLCSGMAELRRQVPRNEKDGHDRRADVR